jgi:hypothetical protein
MRFNSLELCTSIKASTAAPTAQRSHVQHPSVKVKHGKLDSISFRRSGSLQRSALSLRCRSPLRTLTPEFSVYVESYFKDIFLTLFRAP